MTQQIIHIHREPVELYKILKFTGMADSGGGAKNVIADGQVKVNGAVELQKRKKIMSGDSIEFAGVKYTVKLEDSAP